MALHCSISIAGSLGAALRRWGCWVLMAGLLVATAAAQEPNLYQACLGCAEHQEMRTRWHRPWVAQLASASVLAVDHFRLEATAGRMGLCEGDVLLRSPTAVNGCHAYDAERAWLLEAPLELIAFTSPSWGLERSGHPRWAMVLEAVPMSYHALALRHTTEAIRQWQRLEALRN